MSHSVPSRAARRREYDRRNEIDRLERSLGPCRECPYRDCVERLCAGNPQGSPSSDPQPNREMVTG